MPNHLLGEFVSTGKQQVLFHFNDEIFAQLAKATVGSIELHKVDFRVF